MTAVLEMAHPHPHLAFQFDNSPFYDINYHHHHTPHSNSSETSHTTPLESPMEELEAYPGLPMITPPEMNFAAFQFPPNPPSAPPQQQQNSATNRPSFERARSRSVNHITSPPMLPLLPRQQSHHQLTSPPPPLSRYTTYHPHRRASEYEAASPFQQHGHIYQHQQHQHPYHANASISQQTMHISPSFLFDSNPLQPAHEQTSLPPSQTQLYHPLPHLPLTANSISTTSSSSGHPSPATPFSAHTLPFASGNHFQQSSSVGGGNNHNFNAGIAPSNLSFTPTSGDNDDGERPWDLVPYHVPWGNTYVGYKAGTLPGPEGKSLFLRSPTPIKNQRTSQACEKCRERKAKCSGARPSCARCVARGHVCEYGPELKKKTSFETHTTSGSSAGAPPSPPADSNSSIGDAPCLSEAASSPGPGTTGFSGGSSSSVGGIGIGDIPEAESNLGVGSHGGIGIGIGARRGTRKSERLRRGQASVPNLRSMARYVSASSHHSQRKGAERMVRQKSASVSVASDSVSVSSSGGGGESSPIVLANITTNGTGRIRAPMPVHLRVNIPPPLSGLGGGRRGGSIVSSSVSPSDGTSASSPPLTSAVSPGSAPSPGYAMSHNVNEMEMEMTTPAPATALFFHDQQQQNQHPEEIADSQFAQHQPHQPHHAVRYSSSMPQLHMAYTEDLEMGLRLESNDVMAYSEGPGPANGDVEHAYYNQCVDEHSSGQHSPSLYMDTTFTLDNTPGAAGIVETKEEMDDANHLGLDLGGATSGDLNHHHHHIQHLHQPHLVDTNSPI